MSEQNKGKIFTEIVVKAMDDRKAKKIEVIDLYFFHILATITMETDF